MALDKPNALDSEREILAACFKGDGSTFRREDMVKLVTAETDIDMFTHPHFRDIFYALSESVMDAGNALVEWGDVRSLIASESPARSSLKRLLDVDLPPITEKWAKRHVKKLSDTTKCRRILEAQESVKIRALAGDAESAFDDLMEAVFTLGRDKFSSGAMALTDYLPAIHQEIADRRNNNGIVGLETGMKPIDEGLGGLQRKTLTYVGGRPGHFKSTVVAQCGVHVANNGHRVVIASPEMSAEQYTTRWACKMARVDYHKYNRGMYNEEQEWRIHEAVDALSHKNIIINESGFQSTATLRQDIIRFRPDLVIVDYSQLFEPSRPRYSEYADVTMFSKELNSLKKDFGIPVLAAVQLSRKVEERENKRPIKSDIRSSGQIEQDADAIYMMYREREYATQNELGMWMIDNGEGEREADPDLLEWVSAKNRHGAREDYKTYTRDGDIWVYDERQG